MCLLGSALVLLCPFCFGQTPAVSAGHELKTENIVGGKESRAEQSRARQGRAEQGRAGQGRAGQGRAGQGRAGQGRAGQSIYSMTSLS